MSLAKRDPRAESFQGRNGMLWAKAHQWRKLAIEGWDALNLKPDVVIRKEL